MNATSRRMAALALIAAAIAAVALSLNLFSDRNGGGARKTDPGSVDRPGFPITFTDDIGRKIIVNDPPARIVSLSPSITETLFELGLGDRLVGVDPTSDYPAGAESIRKAGTAERPDYEAIALADPDVVITDRKPADDILLARHAPLIVIRMQDPKGVRRAIGTIGRLTDRDDIADALIESLTAGEKAITDQAKAKGALKSRNAKTAVVRLDYPQRPDLSRSHLLAMLRSLGVTETLAPGNGTDPEVAGAPVPTPAEALSARPDLMIIMSPESTRASFESDAEWQNLLTPETGRGLELLTPDDVDPELLLRPGPRYVQALGRLYEVAHPVGIGRPQ